MIEINHIDIATVARNEMVDLTDQVKAIVLQSGITSGQVLVFVPGSTGALSTIEYEPGLLKDAPIFMEKLVPEKAYYFHNETWHDGNGHSHLRATILGPSLNIPFMDKELLLGVWQQVVFFEFDNKPRKRRIVVQLLGE